MSTNFYWNIEGHVRREVVLPTGKTLQLTRGYDDMDPDVHLGKRSGAGRFCWDCMVTLNKGGNAAIHMGRSDWHPACPKCNKTEKDNYPTRFDKVVDFEKEVVTDARPKGIAPCCSFSWAQDPDGVLIILKERPNEPLVIDEYDVPYTGMEFGMMLHNSCPVHFVDSVGTRFS